MQIKKLSPEDLAAMAGQFTHQATIDLDAELRALRDQVYGKPISDAEWDKCKENWRRDAVWLQQQAELAAGEVLASTI